MASRSVPASILECTSPMVSALGMGWPSQRFQNRDAPDISRALRLLIRAQNKTMEALATVAVKMRGSGLRSVMEAMSMAERWNTLSVGRSRGTQRFRNVASPCPACRRFGAGCGVWGGRYGVVMTSGGAQGAEKLCCGVDFSAGRNTSSAASGLDVAGRTAAPHRRASRRINWCRRKEPKNKKARGLGNFGGIFYNVGGGGGGG